MESEDLYFEFLPHAAASAPLLLAFPVCCVSFCGCKCLCLWCQCHSSCGNQILFYCVALSNMFPAFCSLCCGVHTLRVWRYRLLCFHIYGSVKTINVESWNVFLFLVQSYCTGFGFHPEASLHWPSLTSVNPIHPLFTKMFTENFVHPKTGFFLGDWKWYINFQVTEHVFKSTNVIKVLTFKWWD